MAERESERYISVSKRLSAYADIEFGRRNSRMSCDLVQLK